MNYTISYLWANDYSADQSASSVRLGTRSGWAAICSWLMFPVTWHSRGWNLSFLFVWSIFRRTDAHNCAQSAGKKNKTWTSDLWPLGSGDHIQLTGTNSPHGFCVHRHTHSHRNITKTTPIMSRVPVSLSHLCLSTCLQLQGTEIRSRPRASKRGRHRCRPMLPGPTTGKGTRMTTSSNPGNWWIQSKLHEVTRSFTESCWAAAGGKREDTSHREGCGKREVGSLGHVRTCMKDTFMEDTFWRTPLCHSHEIISTPLQQWF